MNNELYHHGIKGQKWGIRRYQNPDGSLTPAGRRRLERKDARWVRRNSERVYRDTYKRSNQELNDYITNTLNPQYEGQNRGRSYVNAFNRQMAAVMNRNVGDVRSPSGRVVQFVARRGTLGVYMALADQGFDMGSVRNGVWDSGRIAYRNTVLERR